MKTVFAKPLVKAHRTDDKGFTILELLVIIGVIAILVALQVPALAGAKSQSKRAQCASNLRQFALATHIYANEYNDRLPSTGAGFWLWDLSWNTGEMLERCGADARVMYCPGTAPRFTDEDNEALFEYYAPGSIHVIGYGITFPGASSLDATNQNFTLTPQPIQSGPTTFPAQLPAERVLLADATISQYGQNNVALRDTYNYTSIQGGFQKMHVSPHLDGKIPAGSNLAMLDGHVEWRKFSDMRPRTTNNGGSPVFWW